MVTGISVTLKVINLKAYKLNSLLISWYGTIELNGRVAVLRIVHSV
jgi:hypothetical protein